MHDLRRQALQGNKTVSRKARSRMSSKPSSVSNSRNQSRAPSDDEEGSFSDSTNFSANSIDNVINSDDIPDGGDEEETIGAWKTELDTRVEQLINRKGSTNQGRETSLSRYCYILAHHYAYEDIRHKTSDLYPAILKSVKAGDSSEETSLALKAVVLTLITIPSEEIYEAVFRELKSAYRGTQRSHVKATAIRCLSAAAMYGGASDDEIQTIMEDLLEIIESDGASIDEADSGDVVRAACEAWGLLATMVDDIEDKVDAAMDVFMEQLESSDVSVQVAAGENIALLYEKSYLPGESDDSESERGTEDEDETPRDVRGTRPVFRQENELIQTLTQLAKESSKSINKKDRKILHTNFADILKTIEDPSRGPRYQTAINQETGSHYGSRMSVRIGNLGIMRIDRWWKLQRQRALRKILGGGFVAHYQSNEVVFESLPVIIMADSGQRDAKPEKVKDRKRGGSRALRHQQDLE